MTHHWQEAQKRARQETGCNIVVSADHTAVLYGNATLGWAVLSENAQLRVQAQTVEGVCRVLEELELSQLGWY